MAKKKKIALIGFGGTIAMVPNKFGSLAPAKSADDLVDQAPGLKDVDMDLTVFQLLNKDSTNLNPDDWKLLINKVAELQTKFDGILITHGTDTMPYTATATAMSLGKGLLVPVIFTGSQLPMVESGTDARANLERAAKVLVESVNANVREVMIVFGDKVLRASRTIKTSEARFDAFDSPGFQHLADITATATIFGPLVNRTSLPTLARSPKTNFETGIASLDVKPGLEPELVRTIAGSPNCKAVILKSLGAGNVPSEGNYSLIPVIKEIVASGKPVIVATKFIGGKALPEVYEAGRMAQAAGAGHASNMTDVATEVKLAWLMGQGIRTPKEVNKAMIKPLVGENDA